MKKCLKAEPTFQKDQIYTKIIIIIKLNQIKSIFYSYWGSFRIFGGPFVWAQAKFKRVHQIIEPHHSVTIQFYILYGPQFPTDGQFIYTIENNPSVFKNAQSFYSSQSDETKQDKVYQVLSHNTNTLTMQWECFGPNNEPINAYCGFYNYFLVVHQCQPYCLQNVLIKIHVHNGIVIMIRQLYNFHNQNVCLTNIMIHYLVKHVHLNQIVKHVHDVHVHQTNMKNQINVLIVLLNVINVQVLLIVQNVQLLIIDSYKMGNVYVSMDIIQLYQILNVKYVINFVPLVLDPILISVQVAKILLIFNLKKQLADAKLEHTFKIQQKHAPHVIYHVKHVFVLVIAQHAILLLIDFQKDQDVNVNLAIMNKIIFVQLVQQQKIHLQLNVKLCNNNQNIWHTNTCNSCDIGFQLVLGECEPICGDSLIKGYEQCENNGGLIDNLCYNCQFQCPAHCQTCDEQTTWPCSDICGDGYITGNEECDDGNTIQYDGCYNCKYQCEFACTKFIKGECFECATETWIINPTVTPKRCEGKCRDRMIVGMNIVTMETLMIQMDAQIVSFNVEMVVHLVIKLHKHVQVVSYLALPQSLIIAKIFVEMGSQYQILKDSFQNNAKMVIYLIFYYLFVQIKVIYSR